MTGKNEINDLWVLALSQFSAIEMQAFRTRKLALEALGRAATEADAWRDVGEGWSRFYDALQAEDFEVAECVAGNQIRSARLRWELAKFKCFAPTQRNSITPLI